MEFFEDIELRILTNTLGVILGFIYGMIAQKSDFCVNGSIKDYILHKETNAN